MAATTTRPTPRKARSVARPTEPSRLMRLLTPEQVAASLGLAVKTLAQARQNAKGPPYHRIGRLVRYAEQDVLAWVSEQRRHSTAGSPIYGLTSMSVSAPTRTTGRRR